MKVISISLALLLAGCAANSGVLPSRPDTVVTTPPAQAERVARPAAAPPVQSQLTTKEEACQWWGKVYGNTANDRDALIPITTELDTARKIAVDSAAPNDPTREATMTKAMVIAVHYVYATPAISPARHRYLAELRCMQPAEEAAPAVKSQLTNEERECQTWGAYFFSIAIDRDQRIPITTEIARVREEALSAAPNNLFLTQQRRQVLAESMVVAVHYIYEHPEESPEQFRYKAERDCPSLKKPAAAGPQY
jgi:hypothetical protein